jgi:hypothetical protein
MMAHAPEVKAALKRGLKAVTGERAGVVPCLLRMLEQLVAQEADAAAVYQRDVALVERALVLYFSLGAGRPPPSSVVGSPRPRSGTGDVGVGSTGLAFRAWLGERGEWESLGLSADDYAVLTEVAGHFDRDGRYTFPTRSPLVVNGQPSWCDKLSSERPERL